MHDEPEDTAAVWEWRAVITDLRAQVTHLERENADLRRQVVELRGAVDALLQPAPSGLLSKNLAHPSRK